MCWLRSPDDEPELGEGLADGDDVPDPEPEVPLGVLPDPVAPEVPEGAEPEPVVAPLPLPLLPVPAATSAGVSIMMPTIREATNLIMSRPPKGG